MGFKPFSTDTDTWGENNAPEMSGSLCKAVGPETEATGANSWGAIAVTEEPAEGSKLVVNNGEGNDANVSKPVVSEVVVDSPDYYKSESGKFQVIDIIERYKMPFGLGSAFKYLVRAGKKSNNKASTDCEKALYYLNREQKELTYNSCVSLDEVPDPITVVDSFNLGFLQGSAANNLLEYLLSSDDAFLDKAIEITKRIIEKENN